jgi:CelD/BcsL family acetyltransferase involved in cellulose biosynthesis
MTAASNEMSATGLLVAPRTIAKGDSGNVGIIHLDARPAQRLALDISERSSVFGSAPWIRALVETYDFDIRASALARGNRIEAAIVFSEVEDIRGRRVVSLPFSDYLDPLVHDEVTWKRLIDPILGLGAPVRFRCLHNTVPLTDARFVQTEGAVWHGVDLRRSEEELWASLKDSAPQNVRRAQRHGVVVREGRSLDDLLTFYRMHCSVRKKKYGMFAQPFAFFENLHAAFSSDDGLVVLLAEVDGIAVAGILFLIHGDTLYYKFNASVDLAYRPNDLLVWSGMMLGRHLGLAHMDFGLSDLEQPGLVRFKDKFATEKRPIAELRWTPPGEADERGQQAGALLHRLTSVLTSGNVPDEVTRAAGDEIYRLFC